MGARGKELFSNESISSTWNAEKHMQCRCAPGMHITYCAGPDALPQPSASGEGISDVPVVPLVELIHDLVSTTNLVTCRF